MIVFLTGATGFVGGAVARLLAAAGHGVRAIVRDPAAAADLRTAGIELHRGDVTDQGSMREAMAGAGAVFHIAGWYKIGVHAPRTARAVNVDGTRNVLELMRELRVPLGVYTSTLAVNSDTHGRVVDETYRFAGRHVSVYDRTKADAHQIAGQFIAGGLPLIIVQPGLIYGPGDTSGVRTLLLDFLQGRLKVIPARTAYSWGYIDDIARGHLLAMARGQPGRNYFLAGPVHTVVEAIDIAATLTGLPKPARVHPAVLRLASAVMRGVELAVRVPPPMNAESLRVLAGVTYLGTAGRARRELGWSARPLADGLAETLRHEQSHLASSTRHR